MHLVKRIIRHRLVVATIILLLLLTPVIIDHLYPKVDTRILYLTHIGLFLIIASQIDRQSKK